MSSLRDLEAASIRSFIQQAADEGYLSGRVLDYGCGKQPYRDIVEAAGGNYTGFDRPWFPAYVGDAPSLGPIPEKVWNDGWDSILCTQVVQYIPLLRYGTDPEGSLQSTLTNMAISLWGEPRTLVLTYPTNWPEVEPEDLHRFTKVGMERLLTEAGFEIVKHEPRASVRTWVNEWLTDELVLGYGVVARA